MAKHDHSGLGVLADVLGLLAGLVVAGVVVGLVANKPLIVAATAFEGAALAVASAVSLLDLAGAHLDREDLVALVATLALAVLGASVQWRSIRHDA